MNGKIPGEPGKKARKNNKKAPSSQPHERLQVAALPWRITKAGLEIMLVSSRETRRWIIPKGWQMAGRDNSAAAAVEALEEAGLLSVISDEPIGHYYYLKRFARYEQNVRVDVFAMLVHRQRNNWPEKDQRTTQWFAAETAAELVSDSELKHVINAFIDRSKAAPAPSQS